MSLHVRETKSTLLKRPNPAKSERLEARVSVEQKKLFQHAADLVGRSLTDFITRRLQEAAIQIIQEHDMLHLSLADKKVFVQKLLQISSPNNQLIKAAQRYHREIKPSDL